MKKLLLSFHFLLISSLLFAQISTGVEKCKTDQDHKNLYLNNPVYRQNFDNAQTLVRNIINSGVRTGGVYTIPVVVHVMHLGSAEGTNENISDAQIQSAIDNLNDAYANIGYNGLDIEIQFALAVRDPNCNPTDGINRINASGLVSGGDAYATMGATDNNRTALKALSNWSNSDYYNIWVVTEIDNNNGGSGTQGYAYFPGAANGTDGTVILYNAFGYDPTGSLGYNLKSYTRYNATTIHELGHALDLYHTFEGDNEGASCPGTSNCSTTGDECCDTDAHNRNDSDCDNILATCNGVNNSTVYNNFMAYSSDDCQDRFTADQKLRMRAAMEGPRASLLSSLALTPPPAQAPNTVANTCSPQSSSQPSQGINGGYGGIMSVTFGNRTSNTSNTEGDHLDYGTFGYLDFSEDCLKYEEFNEGDNIPVSVTTWFNNHVVKVYVDWNNDGDFHNTNELMATINITGTANSGNDMGSANITMPGSVTTDEYLRIRFIADINSPTDDCDGPTYGQVEDYSIYIHPTSTTPVANFSANNTSPCQNSSITFTDASTNATAWSWDFGSGASPATATGQGPHSVTYSTSGNKTVTLDVTGPGGNDNETKSNYITVNSTVSPSVSISSNDADNTICSGTNVTFTATPTNGGTPSYQWKRNGNNVGSNSPNYSNSALADNDQISVVMTSTANCASPATATSNTITMNVNTSVTPTISISASANPITSGDPVTFTANCITNCGSSQSYQWKLNGGNVGTNSTTYNNASLVNGDQISCVITTNAACATTGTSNTITMTVNAGSCINTVYGPGGIGNSANNKIWLDAASLNLSDNATVINWADKSGNNLTAGSQTTSGRPVFKINQINGLPSIKFDGIDDHLRITNLTNVSTTNQTWFVVGNYNVLNKGQAIMHIGATTGNSNQKNLRYNIYHLGSNKIFSSNLNSNGGGQIASHGLSTSTRIFETVFTPTTVTAFTNGAQSGSFNSTTLVSPAANQMLNLGRRGNLNDYYLDGNIAEVIVYNYNLNSTERILVENYLASKYNQTITNDFYSLEGSGHYFEVTGIGMQGGISVTDAEGGSGVQINTPSSMANGDYLLWGHNNASNTVTTTGAPAAYGGTGQILTRTWRADKTNNVGTVTVKFHLDGVLSGTTDYELLVDSDGNFSNATRITSGYSYDAGCDIATWTGVNFNDGDYFTIGNPDGNALFIEPVFESENNLTDEERDEFENASALSVFDNVTETVQLTLYPNPTSGLLYIDNLIEGASIEIYNTLGQVVFHSPIQIGKNQFDFGQFNNGLYIVHLKDINHETIAISQLMMTK